MPSTSALLPTSMWRQNFHQYAVHMPLPQEAPVFSIPASFMCQQEKLHFTKEMSFGNNSRTSKVSLPSDKQQIKRTIKTTDYDNSRNRRIEIAHRAKIRKDALYHYRL